MHICDFRRKSQIRENSTLFVTDLRRIRGSRLAEVKLLPRTGSRSLALLRTRAAALRAPTAAAAETIGIPCVSLTPAEVRKPLRSVRVSQKSFQTRNALRFPSKDACASSGYHQKKCWLKSAEYRDCLDIRLVHDADNWYTEYFSGTQ